MSETPPRSSTRIAALAGALLLAAGAIGLWLSSGQTRASPGAPAPVRAEATATPAGYPAEPEPLLDAPEPERAQTREEKRLARIDRNDDGAVQQAEFLAQRRRNYDKLDTNGDGRLSFAEYAASGIAKFGTADADGNGILNAAEYATTAPPPRKSSASASRQCPPCALAQADTAE